MPRGIQKKGIIREEKMLSAAIELFLKKTGLAPYVTDTECFGDTGMKKAENIRLVVARNGLQQPVYV